MKTKFEECEFEHDGCCYAYVCYSDRKCRAKDEKGNVVCMATVEEIKKLDEEARQAKRIHP